MKRPTPAPSAALRNVGPWKHIDGTPCPHYVASRPRPDDDNHWWWCTEHQQHVQVANPPRPLWCGDASRSWDAPPRRHPALDAVTLLVALGMAVGLVLLLGLYVEVIAP